MAYDPELDARIRQLVGRWSGTTVKKMFGGVCHLMNGNMLGGVYQEYLILRLGPEVAESVLADGVARPFDITGRPMRGWVMMPPDTIADDASLEGWLMKARAFVKTLPEK